jgi:hypothetical protein
MSTMLSSRRFVEPVRPAVGTAGAKTGDRGLSLAVKALVGGFAGLMAGAHFGIDVLMAAGFLHHRWPVSEWPVLGSHGVQGAF